MSSRLVRYVVENRKWVFLTFEVFWILVFLLEAATKGSGPATSFVYVNF